MSNSAKVIIPGPLLVRIDHATVLIGTAIVWLVGGPVSEGSSLVSRGPDPVTFGLSVAEANPQLMADAGAGPRLDNCCHHVCIDDFSQAAVLAATMLFCIRPVCLGGGEEEAEALETLERLGTGG